MNNYINTEKSLKRWFKTKVKVTVATVVGFLIAGTVTFAAGEKLVLPEDGVYTNKVLHELGTSKFVVGNNGNLEIYSNGSVGLFLHDLKNPPAGVDKNNYIEVIRHALWQDKNDENGKYIITGALAGEGKYNSIMKLMFPAINNKLPQYKNLIEALQRFDTIASETIDITGDTKTIIGNDNNSPVVLGVIGGDYAFGTGSIISDAEKEIGFNREGNASIIINNGNVFGTAVGSVAIGLGKISASMNSVNAELTGEAQTTINGNTALNINDGSNGIGLFGGGIAAAIGGTASSNVEGNTTVNINSVVDSNNLEGITGILSGGGVAISTLGGTAEANTKGTTDLTITDALSMGVAGGGIAISTDASKFLKPNSGEDYKIEQGGITATISGLNDGGTSKVTSGDINVKLEGTTSAAIVVGNGLAVSLQNAEGDKLSSSIIEANNTTLDVDLTKNKTGNDLAGALPKLKKVFESIESGDNLIGSMKGAVEALKDGGMAVGIGGNGIALSVDKGISSVTSKNATTNLKGGYVVGATGNGISANDGWAKSTTEVTEKATVNIDGADVVGVLGNGLAYYFGAGGYDGTKDFDGMALSKVADSEINVISGSADGVFGGGVAIDDSELFISNAKSETTGTSTINVNGGNVNVFGYKHLNGILKGGEIGKMDLASYYKEVQALGEKVAIVGGGVAAGNLAEAHVEDSVININGGKVEGNIIAGGIATTGAISTVKNSTININGGEVIGSVYGTGLATEGMANTQYPDQIKEASATVENSVLNINGYKNSLEEIAGFNEINIGIDKTRAEENYNTELTITKGIDVGSGKFQNAGKIVFANEAENSTLITIDEGAEVLNKGLIVVDKGDKIVDNTDNIAKDVKNIGKIQVNGVTSADEEKFDVKDLFVGGFTNVGMVVGTDGKAILTDGEDVIAGDNVTVDEIISHGTTDKITLEHVTITEGGTIDSNTVNVIGNVASNQDLGIANGQLIFDSNGNITVTDETALTLSNVNVLGGGSGISDIKFAGTNSRLILNNTSVDENGVIGESVENGVVEFTGTNNSFGGSVKAKTINIASGNSVEFGENAVGAGTINLNGDAKVAVGAENTEGVYTQNFFHNSNGNLSVNGTGNIIIGTQNFTGEKVTIDLGSDNTFSTDLMNKLDTTEIYQIAEGEDLTDGKLELVYNEELFEEDSKLNEINNAAKVVNDVFSEDKDVRKGELDKIYASNIYSETVRAAYDNIKLNEEAIESLARKSEVGRWTAEGKALYSKNEYDREGTLKDYSSEIESTGLMGALSYGVDETTTAGVAFSGVKQDVDTDGGSADADLFYLGVYGNKVYGNYDFTAGLGYQFGKYDADNTIATVHSSDKYDSKAISGYVQGRYTADLGDGLSVQPKAKLGYTYIDQDDAKDAYFGVSDAEISTFDVEVGADLVKTVALEKGKMNLLAGVSYTRAMGDTDDKFDGRFYGAKATSNKFDVLGAEIAENTVKFNLGAEVTNENGFFYNGGMSYEFGSDDTKAYGVKVGIGYKF